jgi:phosphoheptose isomerase
MMTHTSKQMFAEDGTVTITSASATISGEFVAIQCISDTVFTTLTNSREVLPSSLGGSGGSVATAQTYPAGFTLFGRFTAIRLTSGAVRVTLAASRV